MTRFTNEPTERLMLIRTLLTDTLYFGGRSREMNERCAVVVMSREGFTITTKNVGSFEDELNQELESRGALVAYTPADISSMRAARKSRKVKVGETATVVGPFGKLYTGIVTKVSNSGRATITCEDGSTMIGGVK